jgi:hypothetical protein
MNRFMVARAGPGETRSGSSACHARAAATHEPFHTEVETPYPERGDTCGGRGSIRWVPSDIVDARVLLPEIETAQVERHAAVKAYGTVTDGDDGGEKVPVGGQVVPQDLGGREPAGQHPLVPCSEADGLQLAAACGRRDPDRLRRHGALRFPIRVGEQ